MRIASVRDGTELRSALVYNDVAYLMHDIAAHSATHLALPDTGGAAALLGTPFLTPEGAAGGLQELGETLAHLVEADTIAGHPPHALGPPVPRPGKIICVGRNYAEHARELGNQLPERPILFAKFANAIRGPFDDIVRPREVTDLDYEAELCVVIGHRGKRVPDELALDLVAGYCCANDVSARTAQLALGDQWLRGKSFDSFCPIGPALVTRDEIADPQRLRIQCRVDGEPRQDASTADMIFDVGTLISYCSEAFTLEPGDLILTGTPAGVALGRTPAPWLQPGQVCEVAIEGIGTIANRIAQEQ